MRYLRAVFCVLLVLLFATSALADGGKSQRVSKKKKYSDNGAKCKSVRNGNAALCGRAMIGSNLVTLLEVNTNDENGQPAGTIIKLEIKPKHEGMRRQEFDNINQATFSLNLEGLEKGDIIKVEGKVRGKDGKKKEISLKVPVGLPPSVKVVLVNAPPLVRTQVPVMVTGVIENHGDVAASADCILYADGAQVDVIPQIWIAAGAQVGCQMSHTFTASGLKTLQVSLSNITPGDLNVADNTASVEIGVEAYLPFLTYLAFARETELISYLSGGSSTKRIDSSSSLNGTVGDLDFASIIQRHQDGLETVTAQEFTGAAEIASTFNLKLENGCVKGEALQQARFITICKAPTGEVDFNLEWMVRVTYQSTSVNSEGAHSYILVSGDGTTARFGNTYEFKVRLRDTYNIYDANPIMSLTETISRGPTFYQRRLNGLLEGPIE